MKSRMKIRAGFSLIEILVVIAITVLIFGSIFVAFEFALRLIADSRARMSALSLATDRMEYLRSLPYDAVGTIAGIPAGALPQNRTVTLNGFDFQERLLIEYVDDPGDGLGAADNNGILSDYKRAKIEYTWNLRNATSSFFLVSNIVPRSIETTGGGGSLRVNVFDATTNPLADINVRLLNVTTTTTIDVTRKTNAQGVALFTGAPAAANYEIFVSAAGYSSAQTYQATTTLPNPNPLPVAILEGDVSTMNFQVDRLSSILAKVVTAETISQITETFDDYTGLATTTATVVLGGALELATTGFNYESVGEAWLVGYSPTPNVNWGFLDLVTNLPPNTEVRAQFYTSTNSADIITDADLPGNTSGFTTNQIDLRVLPVATYPEIYIKLLLSTSDNNVTPRVAELNLSYRESENPLASSNFNLRGNKTIGTMADLTPVYKTNLIATTGINGEATIYNVEWDGYYFSTVGGMVVADACPSQPFLLAPNTVADVRFRVQSGGAHNLRVVVQNSLGEPIVGAAVRLTRAAFDQSLDTSWCGQSFFGSLTSANDYTLEIGAAGFSPETITGFGIDGSVTQIVVLNP